MGGRNEREVQEIMWEETTRRGQHGDETGNLTAGQNLTGSNWKKNPIITFYFHFIS